MNFEKLKQQGEQVALAARLVSRTQVDTYAKNALFEEASRNYGRDLRAVVSRAARRITRSRTGSPHVDVWVDALVDHRDYTVKPLVKIRYVNQKIDVKLQGFMSDQAALDLLLERFDAVLAANGRD